MKVTIREVARQANVAPSTVSRVLKNSPSISQATKDKVNEIIKKLGYHPNEIARSLANKSSQTLGIVMTASAEDSFLNPFFTQFILGVTRYIENFDYSLLLSSAKNEEDELNQISRAVNSKRVDGIILLTVREQDENVKYLLKSQFPFVVVGRPNNEGDIMWVDNDNTKAMKDVTETLISSGHKRIAFIGGSQKLQVTKSRLLGYKEALQRHEYPVEKDLIIEADFTEEEGYRATVELLKKQRDIDAIVTTDDLIAYGSMGAIKDLGYQIPQDISVTGFNNTLLAPYLSPSLTSVEINATELGCQAAKILLKHICDEELESNHHIVDTKLILRSSTK
ncbi:LacI family DNA-binding transcriptional regulator [Alkaliphilus hydrothermalis]|uniref:DNA-binding LacI/PurR family transcriptional regulator n=1 Tax=Alkaliphilus hydrothermalis TaxID=1482730 RepID=A0ABS2NRT0_9FIRM|nr:LacI family DNA-binding transcriptional regulator [Alkaliphilus hydrothermalis]MBM7615653.1 DNA-binding LacI/PurR family transcriptional regulator [Alkaliphilus hydrothermalis]